MKTKVLCTVAIALIGLAGCRCREENKKSKFLHVKAAKAEFQESDAMFNATIIPHFEKEFGFAADGLLSFVIGENTPVKKNQILAELKAEKLNRSLDSLRKIQTNIFRKLKREEKLLLIGDFKQRDYDKTEAEYLSITQQVDAIQVQVDANRIIAPMDGVIGKTYFDEGEYITSGKSVISFNGNGQNKAYFSIPSRLLPHIQQSDTLAFNVSNRNSIIGISKVEISPSSGKVTNIIAHFDSTAYTNNAHLLTPGLQGTITNFGSVKIESVVIPASALIMENSVKTAKVWVIADDMTISSKKITIGSKINHDFQIIHDGLEEGQLVVINPTSKLKEGMKVDITDMQ